MRILLLTSEEWNDFTYSNGVLTNWFTGFDAEFAQIYTSPGMPNNTICRHYFRISDAEMARSLISHTKAGHVVQMPKTEDELEASKINAKRQGLYGTFKRISIFFHTPVVLLRDFIWLNGKYNMEGLQNFIDDFNPDIIFSARYASPKMMRLEKVVHSLTDAPMVAFTADDEASLQQYSWSPLYWLRRVWVHRMFEKHIPGLYRHYCMFSGEQAKEYSCQYGVPSSTLFKCGNFPEKHLEKSVGKPIRMVYAGRLYCNRWKTLAEIGKALKIMNKDGERIVLDIYTQEEVSSIQRKSLCSDNSIYLHNSVTSDELRVIYSKADIALHVESMDKKNRLATRYSFSTKIIDLMASSCAIIAVCWNRHAGFQYLKKQDAAICIDNYKDILPVFESLVNNPTLIRTYSLKAYLCGKENHSPEIIHNQMMSLFQDIISGSKGSPIYI